jgi:integrase
MSSTGTRRANGSGSAGRYDPKRRQIEGSVTLADGTRRTVRGNTQREYEQKRDALLTAVETGRPTPTQVLRVKTYMADWLESFRVSTLPSVRGTPGSHKRSTYRTYEMDVRRRIVPCLGEYPLVKLGRPVIKRDLRDVLIKKGVSVHRVNATLTTLCKALNDAKELGLIPDNPAARMKLRAPDNSRVDRALRPDQMAAVLEAMRPYRYAALITFLVCSGLRLGEARALRWSEVDFTRRELRVEKSLDPLPQGAWERGDTKAHRRRVVPLIAPAVQALLTERDHQAFTRRRVGEEIWQDNGLVFTNDAGDPVGESTARDGFKRGLKMAGLDPTEHRVHDLRHTTGAYLHMLGVPLPTIMKIMGHSTLVMAQRYSAVFDSMLDEARDKLDALFARMGV